MESSPSTGGRRANPIRSAILCLLGWPILAAPALAAVQIASPPDARTRSLISEYCIQCHDTQVSKGGLNLETLILQNLSENTDAWEKVVRKLTARQMPPIGKPRPDDATYTEALASLISSLDRLAVQHPNPGRTQTFRRLNRIEYQNAIRDLLALDIDASTLLPKDDASHGFDNVTVADLSPTLLNRYLSAATRISRLALGTTQRTPGGETYRVRADLTQEEHVDGLPLGTRGGARWKHTFPRDGEYEVQVRLARDRNEEIEGLHEDHELDVLLDRERVALFTVAPPRSDRNFEKVDAHLRVRFPATAGPHELAVTFPKKPTSVLPTRRQPYAAHFNMHRHPRLTPAVYQVSVNGPFVPGPAGAIPSRRRILGDIATSPVPADPALAAENALRSLMRRAYRRPVAPSDLETPMRHFRTTFAEEGFDAGMEAAVSVVLVHPEFLFRIETPPAGVESGSIYPVSDLALASRLSFFLWSSIPDDELLAAAERGELHRAEVLEAQTRRMLADPRALNLAQNFASQWLHLRNLDSFTPDLRLYPDFDDNLRQAFRRETELHLEHLLREDRSVLELIRTDHTYLNERLARHYDIPNIYGSRFRRVDLPPGSPRGGLLRHGSILAVTSYATRTSPVLRGHWVLGNLLGCPPPPPPANVPALTENSVADSLPMRQRLAQHRANPACASCHDLMDPIGFALENFDASGRWRIAEDGTPLDVSGGLPDGSRFDGVAGLEDGLLRHPEPFVGTFAEKLLTFALGRGIDPSDAPAVRQIVRAAGARNYRISSLLIALVQSKPFTHRKAP